MRSCMAAVLFMCWGCCCEHGGDADDEVVSEVDGAGIDSSSGETAADAAAVNRRAS